MASGTDRQGAVLVYTAVTTFAGGVFGALFPA